MSKDEGNDHEEKKVKWTKSTQGFSLQTFQAHDEDDDKDQLCALQSHANIECRQHGGIDFKWDSSPDTGSGFTSTANEEPVDDAVHDQKGLGMTTNAGGKRTHKRGKTEGLNAKVWTDETGAANAFSFAGGGHTMQRHIPDRSKGDH